MFKITFKTFKDKEGTQMFDLLEEAGMFLFRNLGGETQRIELYENTGTVENPFYRIILSFHRMKETEPFITNRLFNIF